MTAQHDTKLIMKGVEQILSTPRQYAREELVEMVKRLLDRKDLFMKTGETPCYLFDAELTGNALDSYKKAFKTYVPDMKHYYAVKTNYYAELLKMVLDHGLGLDVSSARELRLAEAAGCEDIVYTGPGKTVEDIRLMIRSYDEKAILNIDSFGELYRASQAAQSEGRNIRAGVRIYTDIHGAWSKFGIPLEDLATFWKEAKKARGVEMRGIHFHLSWNADGTPYERIMEEISGYLKSRFTKEMLNEVEFIDIGGGFRPYKSEGFYPWNTPEGMITKAAYDALGKEYEPHDKHYITPALSIDEYAKAIGSAIDTQFRPLVNAQYLSEPGRILSNQSMHILLRVVDKKSDRVVITDGGINIVGWERFEYDYFPLINLTHPSLTEIPCDVYGPLCMPQDTWGYGCYASEMQEGDMILVPYQGCLTYALAQSFIKEIPPVRHM